MNEINKERSAYLPPSHDSIPYRITDALIAIAFICVVFALLGGWL